MKAGPAERRRVAGAPRQFENSLPCRFARRIKPDGITHCLQRRPGPTHLARSHRTRACYSGFDQHGFMGSEHLPKLDVSWCHEPNPSRPRPRSRPRNQEDKSRRRTRTRTRTKGRFMERYRNHKNIGGFRGIQGPQYGPTFASILSPEANLLTGYQRASRFPATAERTVKCDRVEQAGGLELQ